MALNETATEPMTDPATTPATSMAAQVAGSATTEAAPPVPWPEAGPEGLAWFARRFPLVPRRALRCSDLDERIVIEVAGPADRDLTGQIHGSDPGMLVARARLALDRAAVIASDCRRPDVAVDLCQRHLDIYTNHYTARPGPVSLFMADAMLEPARNLARLLSLQGQTDEAVALITELATAVADRRPALVAGASLPLDRIEVTPDDRRHWTAQSWAAHVRTGLLADGIKAYALADRWTEAAYLVEDLEGLSPYLTEPRQAMILAGLTGHDLPGARRHLAETAGAWRWEDEIATCLRVLTAAPPDRLAMVEVMVAAFRASVPEWQLAPYRARYGVTVTLLARAAGHRDTDDVARQLVAEALDVRDGHAAREVLRHLPDRLTVDEHAVLGEVVDRSGLTGGPTGKQLSGKRLVALRDVAEVAVGTLEEALY